MNIEIMTIAWGEKHLEMWRNSCLKSLSFPKNKRALCGRNVVWNFFTEDKYFDHVERCIDASLPEVTVKCRSKTDLRNYIDPVQAAAILLIENCIKKEKRLIMAPPDTIWGDGSVEGIVKVGRERGTCVVVPHIRVLPSIMSEGITPYLSNAELVALAFKKDENGKYEYMHRSWTDAEVGHPLQNSFVGGVDWQKIDEGLYEVRHRLPTVYLADFLEEDLNYFKSAISFGGWDHTWPGDVLMRKGRQRFVGSSDIAFMAEITEMDKNVPPLWQGSPDDFWRHHYHNEHNKMVSAVFREAK